MSISIVIAVHPHISLPPGSRVHIRTPYGSQTLSIPGPGMFFESQISGSLPSGYPLSKPPTLKLELDFDIGKKQTRMVVDNAPDDLCFALTVLPKLAPESKTFLTGNIIHPKMLAETVTGCVVRCLNDDRASVDGNCCVECENDDAIVKICC